MALLLSIETSTHSFSCALHREGKLIGQAESLLPQTTASMLAVMIEKLFNDAQVKKNILSGVVVASGPGSYTGLRIGVATAKGICYALNIPLTSVNTLYLMAYQVRNLLDQNDSTLLCPMLDARRMEVYCTLLNYNLDVVEPIQAKVLDENSFDEQLRDRTIYFFGEGSDKFQSIVNNQAAKFISKITPSANALGELGYQKFIKTDFEDIEHFEPFYLKDFLIKKPNSLS
jgi:tRNA threonylcarbamoyladenosine biosynthesis protein TsaB